jgi:hypothetical protein
MTDERRGVVESNEPDPELQLSFTLRDRRVTDAEIGQLRELARWGTVEAVRGRSYAVASLAGLAADHLRVIEELCAPPRPLESAVQGVEVDDPDGFVSAVNAAACDHGIDEPVVEASGRTVRATTPPAHLVGAILDRLKREADQRKLRRERPTVTR